MKKVSILLMIVVVFAVSLTNSVSGDNAGITNKIDTSADVHLDFDGLMAICFGNPERVSIGLLDVAHHTPEVTITSTRNNQTKTLITLKGADLRDSLYIDLAGAENNQIARYQAATMEGDPKDFRWTIDMESDLFQKQLYVKEDRLFSKIHISTALFYSELLSQQKVQFFSADGKQANFNRQIAAPTAQISLKDGQVLVIKNKKRSWQLVGAEGITYRINIHNLPPADMAGMDHFLFYYDAIGEKVTNYGMVVMSKAAYYPRPLLCEPIIFSKSSLKD